MHAQLFVDIVSLDLSVEHKAWSLTGDRLSSCIYCATIDRVPLVRGDHLGFLPHGHSVLSVDTSLLVKRLRPQADPPSVFTVTSLGLTLTKESHGLCYIISIQC
jgi:hypothetical protein